MSTSNKKAYVFEMNLISANIFAILIFILAFIGSIYVFGFRNDFENPFIFITLIIYFCSHEALHGLGYYLGGCNPKNISYGVLLEKGIFYCMCYQEITKKNILISLQMPFTILTVLAYLVAVIFHIPFLGFLAIINFMGASMDMAMFAYISRIKNVHYSESGKPNEFVLITEEDLKKKKSIFLRLKEVRDYKKEDYQFSKIKKFEYTKASLFVLFGCILLDFIMLLLG